MSTNAPPWGQGKDEVFLKKAKNCKSSPKINQTETGRFQDNEDRAIKRE